MQGSARKKAETGFQWIELTKHVRQFMKNYQVFRAVKTKNVPCLGLLQPLPIPEEVWLDISINFISGFPKSRVKMFL